MGDPERTSHVLHQPSEDISVRVIGKGRILTQAEVEFPSPEGGSPEAFGAGFEYIDADKTKIEISGEAGRAIDTYISRLKESPEEAEQVKQTILEGFSGEERERLEGLMGLVCPLFLVERPEMRKQAKRNIKRRIERARKKKFG